jgi:hypothetical protein
MLAHRNASYRVVENTSYQGHSKMPNAGERKFPDHPESAKKSDFWEKSDFSNRAQGAHQEIRFLGKI